MNLERDFKIHRRSVRCYNSNRAVTRIFWLNEFADAMFFSAEEKVAKPDSAFYHIAIKWLGVQPDEIVFVDDRPENIEAANSIGMHGVLYQNNEQTIADVRRAL